MTQRAGNKGRVKTIHAKIANRRKDSLYKLSTELVRESAAVFVGNVNSKALSQTPPGQVRAERGVVHPTSHAAAQMR